MKYYEKLIIAIIIFLGVSVVAAYSIGMFVNSLPLKNHVDSSMRFLTFLEMVKENCMEAFEHQLYPFDDLVNDLAMEV